MSASDEPDAEERFQRTVQLMMDAQYATDPVVKAQAQVQWEVSY
jgi:hypothetical protein